MGLKLNSRLGAVEALCERGGEHSESTSSLRVLGQRCEAGAVLCSLAGSHCHDSKRQHGRSHCDILKVTFLLSVKKLRFSIMETGQLITKSGKNNSSLLSVLAC